MKYTLYTVNRLCRNMGVGDYEVSGYPDWWEVEVTETGNAKFNKLLLIHELVECMLTQESGIEEHLIDQFDAEFLESNPEEEPGDSVTAPYHKEHVQAEYVEKYLAEAMGVNWGDYSNAIERLIDSYESKR